MGQTCQHFWFVLYSVEFHLNTSERVFVGHHPFQFRHHQINCPRNFNFHNWKDGGQDVPHIWIKYHQAINKASQAQGQGKRKGKGGGYLLEIVSLKAFVDWEQWKVPISRECIQPNYWQ